MSIKAESRKRQRKADRDIDNILQEENATLLADLSANFKRYRESEFSASQDPSLRAIPFKDSTSSTLANVEDIFEVSGLEAELPHDDNSSIKWEQNNDGLFLTADGSDSDTEDEYSKEYFDYGLSEDDLLKNDFPVQLVNHKIDRSDVDIVVWKIIIGEDEEPNSEEILKTKLTQWALQFKTIPRNAVDSLLHILNDHGHPSLPLCSKTLLKTPRNVDKFIRIVAGGQFWYRGILQGILSVLNEAYLIGVKDDEVKMDVFVDGISPYKSVKRSLWPIAGCLVDQEKPFVIALWCGSSKEPQSVDEFLHDFIEEFLSLKDGFPFKSRTLTLKIRFFIADAPARAWLRKVNQHGSYFCCERCTVKGEWKFSRMTYNPNVRAPMRTDDSFKNQDQEQYHKGTSTLLSIGISMISQFPLDIMHLIGLGVTKRLLSNILKTKGRFKLPAEDVARLDHFCEFLYRFTPAEFARKRRPLSQWGIYKASEFRRFLLYDGLLVFKLQNHKQLYNCFLLLSCAMRILLDSDLRSLYAEDSHDLFIHFLALTYKVLGPSFNVYNVHHLEHLCQEVLLHGDPNKFSCYKYDNQLGQIKTYLLAPGRTLQQIICRMIEQSLCSPKNEVPAVGIKLSDPHKGGPVLDVCGRQYRTISLPKCKISCDHANSCVLTESNEVVIVFNIIQSPDSTVHFIGKKFINKRSYFN